VEYRCPAHRRGRPSRIRSGRPSRRKRTTHRVSIARETHQRLTAGEHTPERCLDAAFRFLLDREPKESILQRFDVEIIGRYFPEFERELPRYLA